MKPWRLVFWILLALLVSALAAAGAVRWWLDRPLPLSTAAVELSIEPGTPPREVAAAWVRAGGVDRCRLAVRLVPLQR